MLTFVGLTMIYSLPIVKPISTLMVYDWIRFKNVDRQWTKINDMPKTIWEAAIMSEDNLFCSHHGVDVEELKTIITKVIEGEKTRGASTISMQNAKNLFLWANRSYIRKALEMPIAIIIDAVWTKKRMMEIYLNIVEWGEGIYGINAAAKHHFKKPIAKLTKREISLLIVSLPNPYLRNPAKPSRGMLRLARGVEKRLRYAHDYSFCIKK